ncbi:MAG: response regulator transcription factor [Acidobacteria bacterium]|nr:response regulator transcription factor [Acidobacteriota bacterium]
MSDIRVVIAEDEFFTRQGICRLIDELEGFRIVGEASQGAQAIELVRSEQPDVLLLDVRMPPGLDGIQVIKTLRAEKSPVAIVVLSNEKRVIRSAQEAGANGYVPKDKHQMFLPTLQCVVETGQRVFINPEYSEAYNALRKRVSSANLNESEMVVWGLLAFRNEEISRRCHKAIGRVRNIVTELYFKLDIPKNGELSQRFQAVEMARMLGILVEPERDFCHEY